MIGPKITLGAQRPPPHTHPSGKIVILEKSTWPNLNVCTISTFYSYNTFPDMSGPKFTLGSAASPHAPSVKFLHVTRVLGPI